MSKLTKCRKVYRGIAGLALPKQFWEPNEYNVKGGVENGFMSAIAVVSCVTARTLCTLCSH